MGTLVGWKHCPRCAAALENDGKSASCEACGFTAYASAEPTAGALILDEDGRVLLSRRAFEPEAGKWDVPGGFLGVGEEPLDALRRELREEAGFEIEPLELVGIWADTYGTGEDANATLNLLDGAHRVGRARRRGRRGRAPLVPGRRPAIRPRAGVHSCRGRVALAGLLRCETIISAP